MNSSSHADKEGTKPDTDKNEASGVDCPSTSSGPVDAAEHCVDNNGEEKLFARRVSQVVRSLAPSVSDDEGLEDQECDPSQFSGCDGSSGSWSTTLANGHVDPTCACSRLKRISVLEARNRSFLVGSATSYGSLLGKGQLDDHFHDRNVTILVGTWNMNEIGQCDRHLEDFLLPTSEENIPDVYVIGTQENSLPRMVWEVAIQEAIGLSHVLLHSTVLGTLHMGILVRRELLWFFSAPEESSVATRQGTAIKTKGAVGMSFKLFGTSFLIINSHLTAHDHNVKERISDYEKICEGLELPKKMLTKSVSSLAKINITSRFDCTFWLGDLNFRLSLPRNEVLRCLCTADPIVKELLENDQLQNVVDRGHAFCGFSEAPIHFAPSYKFDIGTDCYDSSEKQRTPAYTDRILYRHKEKTLVKCMRYSSVPSVQVSDHKPVYAIFQVRLRPGRDDIPLAAGMFNRDVYLKAIETRAAALNPLLQKGSKLCSVM